MRLRSLLSLGILALGAAACDPDRAVVPEQVVGVWTDSLSMSEGITWAHTLDLRPGGEFHWDQITYGGDGYGHDVPVYRTVVHGQYRLRAGAFDVRVEKVEYSGVEPGRTITDTMAKPKWTEGFYRARLAGDDLEISWTMESMDAPREYRLTFTRKPPGQPID